MKQDEDSAFTGTIEPYMIKPLVEPGPGYVPLCAALHWIITRSGMRRVAMDDDAAWRESVGELLPLIHEEEIELIGLPCGLALPQRFLPGARLALVRVLPPVRNAIGDILANSPSHISCCAFIDKEHWFQGFNDKLHEKGRSLATWTHLEVRKGDVLSRWPKSGSGLQPERNCEKWLVEQMRHSPHSSPRPRNDFLAEAKNLFPTLANRQFDRAWGKAISETGADWSRPGKRKKSPHQSPTDEI
jgi:hypothetical protein